MVIRTEYYTGTKLLSQKKCRLFVLTRGTFIDPDENIAMFIQIVIIYCVLLLLSLPIRIILRITMPGLPYTGTYVTVCSLYIVAPQSTLWGRFFVFLHVFVRLVVLYTSKYFIKN